MTDEEARETLRGMLADWEAATPEQRRAALAAVADDPAVGVGDPREYAFGVKAFAVVRVRAASQAEARRVVDTLDLRAGAEVTGWSAETVELFEIDGLDPLDAE